MRRRYVKRKIKFKRGLIFLSLLLIFGLVSCSESKKEEKLNEFKINIPTILEYKGSYVGDNSAVSNIIYNLPGNTYMEGMKLKTEAPPYGININYRTFEDITIIFEDNSKKTLSFEKAMTGNSIILFSLLENCELINLEMDNGEKIEYKKDYGENLEGVTKDKESLEKFIKGL